MNKSQRAEQQLADTIDCIIDAKYKRYAETVVERLDGEISPLSLSAVGSPATRWKEFKSQLRQKPWSYSRRITEQFVKKCCSELLRELPADERSVLSLADSAYSAKANPFVLELYDRVQDLARNEAEREAFFAKTPSESKLPVSKTSDEIVIPLADFLVTSELCLDLSRALDRAMVNNNLSSNQSEEEVEREVRQLLLNNPNLLDQEAVADALELPRYERGESLFESLYANLSTGQRDYDF